MPLTPTPPTVTHVEAAFARISRCGDFLAADANAKVKWPLYRSIDENFDGIQNHFQGIQRLRDSRYFVVSGGDWKSPAFKPARGDWPTFPHTASHLLVVKLGSRPTEGPCWSNVATGDLPATDEVVNVIEVDEKHWHAGGMDLLDTVLAVPVEYTPPGDLPLVKKDQMAPGEPEPDKPSSRVFFYDFADPDDPVRLDIAIERSNIKATAVALTRMLNGQYLAAVFAKGPEESQIDFYVSKGTDLLEGFPEEPAGRWLASRVLAVGEQSRNFSGFQCLNFVRQTDGALYLLGFHNTSGAAPTVSLKDYGDLYQVQIAEDDAAAGTVTRLDEDAIRITKVANLQFECRDKYCNFDAGAGVSVHDDTMSVYAVYHWLTKYGRIRMTEFRPPVFDVPGELTMDNAWIEMYEDVYFEGRRLELRGLAPGGVGLAIPNFDRVKAQGDGFEDKPSSLRYVLPKGASFTVFEDKDYKDELKKYEGKGKLVEIPVMHGAVEGEISSLRVNVTP